MSIIFGHDLLVLSEFRRRRHGWSVEIKPVAESILSQLINKSAGDLANEAPERDLKRRGDGSGDSECGSWARFVSAVLVFSPGALGVRFHPPPRLFKTGYGANNFQRAHISFHSLEGVGGVWG